ncbi:MAG TPA: envelope stress response membrane protein PspB [Allosphingosinicella sp.]|uniref:envelope stress response membrane protein PspB n=1 Tax=Allosphingosinicella sp. TaxID=2823234 RepID=UPI002ED85F19
MEEVLIPLIVVPTLFIALPWLIFHYVTKWKSQATLTAEDENLLDELHETARRLDERLCSIERIMTAENPGWRQVACDPASIGIEDQLQSLKRIKQ